MAIKGSTIPTKPVLVSRPKAQDVNWRGKVVKAGVMLWTVGTDTAKHMIFNRLLADQGVEPEARKIHFSEDLPPEYYDGLASEAFDPEKNKWVKRRQRQRNEALDLTVYNFAAAQHPEIRVHAMRKRDWDKLEKILQPEDGNAETPAPAPEPDPANKRRMRSKGIGGFVNRWKK